jgi:MraZ protein
LFRGTHFLNLDTKGRLAIPASQRALLAEYCDSRIIVTADPQRCLIVYPEPHFEAVEKKLNEKPTMSKTVRALARVIVGYATSATMDAQGRILISPAQREFAGLTKEVALVGVGNRYELWDEKVWQQTLKEAEEIDLDALAADPQMADFSL